MLRSLRIRGFRSLRDFRMRLGRVTVVTGDNGVGKSNVYRALSMMRRLAAGEFAAAVAEEGGLPSALWAGATKKNEPRRISWELQHSDFRYQMECGMIPATPGDPTRFKTDPDVKLETLRFGGEGGRVVARRKGCSIELRRSDGSLEQLPLPIHAPESMLSEMRDAVHYPELLAVRETLLGWRFYHHFSTAPHSRLRQPVTGFWSPVLEENGENLAANLQTLVESRRAAPLDEAVENAFPGCNWSPLDNTGRFQLRLLRPGLERWLNAAELSDGTLRFFCLCAALLTSKPPPLMVFNEPESSLHHDLISPLADLIAQASGETQIVIVTHSDLLARAIEERCDAKRLELVIYRGETRLKGGETSKRVWTFDDDDDDHEAFASGS
jgi:predicted ATPase